MKADRFVDGHGCASDASSTLPDCCSTPSCGSFTTYSRAVQLSSTYVVSRSTPSSFTNLLLDLSYPALCLLVAWMHWDTIGHSEVNFEMLRKSFEDAWHTSNVMPVTVNGVSIGMMRCSKAIMLGVSRLAASLSTCARILIYSARPSRRSPTCACLCPWRRRLRASETPS